MGSPGQHLKPEVKDALRSELLANPDEPATDIARRLGVNRTTAQRLRRDLSFEAKPVTFPSFVVEEDDDGEEPIEEIIGRKERNFTRAKSAQDRRKWFRIEIPDKKPIGVLFYGDPHLDDDGCNWPVLRRHARLCKETPGLYGANIGDTTNCWGGKLVRLYANQESSVKTARRLAAWFLLESNIRWIVWLMGNHEHMGDGAPVLEEMNRRYGTTAVPMLDWQADFILSVGGTEFKISAAHDFKGASMWNPVHGAVKAAKFGDQIDLLVCGHKHEWAISQWELPEQGNVPLMVRARGYKHMDEHALRHGFGEQQEGQAILVIFDPAAKSKAGRIQAFVDVERGVDILNYLRSR